MAIWKKKSKQKRQTENVRPPAAPSVETSPPVEPTPPPQQVEAAESFCVGETMQIKGELTGRIDVKVAGRVEGKIILMDRNLIVEKSARVIAEVQAKCVIVRGQIAGDIKASERVEIEPSGCVLGDVTAPAIALADGSRFTGSINKEAPTQSLVLSSKPLRQGTEETRPSTTGSANNTPSMKGQERRGKDRPWRGGRKSTQPSHSL